MEYFGLSYFSSSNVGAQRQQAAWYIDSQDGIVNPGLRNPALCAEEYLNNLS